mgnify:CR=1 FL=1
MSSEKILRQSYISVHREQQLLNNNSDCAHALHIYNILCSLLLNLTLWQIRNFSQYLFFRERCKDNFRMFQNTTHISHFEINIHLLHE